MRNINLLTLTLEKIKGSSSFSSSYVIIIIISLIYGLQIYSCWLFFSDKFDAKQMTPLFEYLRNRTMMRHTNT